MEHPPIPPPRSGLHRLRRPLTIAGLVLLIPFWPASAEAQTDRTASPSEVEEAVELLKAEGFERSQVMEWAGELTDVFGPRLTGAPETLAAAHWVLDRLGEWGVREPRLEWWGPFGRGWSNRRMVAHVLEPMPFPVIAHPHPWTPGTAGPMEADVVLSPFLPEAEEPGRQGPRTSGVQGKVVLMAPEPHLPLLFEPQAERLSRDELERIAREPPSDPPPSVSVERPEEAPGAADEPTVRERLQHYGHEGALAVLTASSRPPGGGTVHLDVSGASLQGPEEHSVPVLSLAAEHYGRIYRLVRRGLRVRMELDVENVWSDEPANGFNILGEVGGDRRPQEVVTLGAHFDSWHLGTGATDNAAGVAVVMEAMRILSRTDVALDRTVRLALWTGEEQGLVGSRVHVLRHYGTVDEPAPAHGTFSLYLNVDNGAGAIRGISLQGNRQAQPIFQEWLQWVDSDSISVRHTSLRHAGGTDHLSFQEAGLPGFQFIQDPLEYGARTHHTSMDVYERLPAEDLQHNAVVLAVLAFLAANHVDLLPRD